MRVIPYGRQDISDADIQAVVDVLRSDFLTQGPAVPAFERALAARCGAAHVVAMNSATSALHVACMALDVGPGDWVWTSPITFVASANCALYCGANVDFVDIDPRTYNMSVECLADKLVRAEKNGRLPKVVIPVHLSGQSCDMAGIHALGRRYGFRIVEDASHAIGATHRGRPVGACQYSDIAIFSFHPVKIVTTAEGGAAVTNDAEIAERLRLLRTHGITRDPKRMTGESDAPWYYEQVALGYNYRMTDVQAALGTSQLKRIDDFLASRHRIAERYDAELNELPVTTPWRHPDNYSAFHLYVVRLKLDQISRTHREVFDALRASGIAVALHYIPVYKQPYYRQLGIEFEPCPNAEAYYAEAISIPMYAALSESDQGEVIRAMSVALGVPAIA